MSEYQYIEFRAVDRPLTDKELAYAEKQSSRADISRWRFSNEYNYSDFRGNVDGMLSRGYDVFLHYANFGISTIKIRFPSGLPFQKSLWSKYIDGEFLKWKPDSSGDGGILVLDPWHESFDNYREFHDCLADVIALRECLIAGDLRPLYILWICVADDENFDPSETVEPPVPCGLQEFDLNLEGLFNFFEIDPLLMDAAADIPSLLGDAKTKTLAPAVPSATERLKPWLKSLNKQQAKDHLEQLLVGDTASVKSEILKKVARDRAKSKRVDWPTVIANRTFEELLKKTEVLREEYQANEDKKKAAKAKRDLAKTRREREKRLANMIEDPQKWLTESEQLAEARGRANYKLAAEILADLKEAIGGAKGTQIAHKHAAHLTRKHPTLTQLKGALRKHGVLN